MSKTYRRTPDEKAFTRAAKVAKTTVKLSADARKLRKNFAAYIARKAWNEEILT